MIKKVVTIDVMKTHLKDIPYLEMAFEKRYDEDLNENKKTRMHLGTYPMIFLRLFKHNRITQSCSGAYVQRIVSMYGLELFKKQHEDLIDRLKKVDLWDIDLELLSFIDHTIQYHPRISKSEGDMWLQTLDYVSSEIEDLSQLFNISKTYLAVIILCMAFLTGDVPQKIKDELSKEIILFGKYLKMQNQEEKR